MRAEKMPIKEITKLMQNLELQQDEINSVVKDDLRRAYALGAVTLDYLFKEAKSFAKLGSDEDVVPILAQARLILDSFAKYSVESGKDVYTSAKRRYDNVLKELESTLNRSLN